MKIPFLLYILTFCTTNPIKCGDLLERYAEKPQHLEFVTCVEGTGQVKLVATYKVSGENSEEVEQFLIQKYDIGKLKFTCCGWESSNGKNGYLEHKTLKKVNPNYTLEISMFGSAEMLNEVGEYYSEMDRTNIEFYVMVRIVEV